MARSVAKLKMGFYPLPESEGRKLRALLTFTGPASVVDPCVGQGTALNLLTQGADVRRYGVELDAERALAASAKGIDTIQGNTFDAVAKPESFSLLYLNPPYDSETGSVGNSRMERLFLEHSFRWLVMEGVLVLVIPFERLHECAGILSSHFTRLNIFRMTDEESVRFRQSARTLQGTLHPDGNLANVIPLGGSLSRPDGNLPRLQLSVTAHPSGTLICNSGRSSPIRPMKVRTCSLTSGDLLLTSVVKCISRRI